MFRFLYYFCFYIPFVSLGQSGWSLVHSLGFVYQFSSDFYSMTAGGLLDMYLISCLSACRLLVLDLLILRLH
jgi:hypothetical protein